MNKIFQKLTLLCFLFFSAPREKEYKLLKEEELSFLFILSSFTNDFALKNSYYDMKNYLDVYFDTIIQYLKLVNVISNIFNLQVLLNLNERSIVFSENNLDNVLNEDNKLIPIFDVLFLDKYLITVKLFGLKLFLFLYKFQILNLILNHYKTEKSQNFKDPKNISEVNYKILQRNGLPVSIFLCDSLIKNSNSKNERDIYGVYLQYLKIKEAALAFYKNE